MKSLFWVVLLFSSNAIAQCKSHPVFDKTGEYLGCEVITEGQTEPACFHPSRISQVECDGSCPASATEIYKCVPFQSESSNELEAFFRSYTVLGCIVLGCAALLF